METRKLRTKRTQVPPAAHRPAADPALCRVRPPFLRTWAGHAAGGGSAGPAGENGVVNLVRAGWLAVVLICVLAIVVLLSQSYYGYAAVTLAVALSAAINLR